MAKAEARQEDPAELAARRQSEQRREREKRARERAALGGLWSRRDVFGRFGWGIFAAFSGISLVAALRSAFPRVLFAPVGLAVLVIAAIMALWGVVVTVFRRRT